MDRRKSIKALLIGGVSTGVIIQACQSEEKKTDGTKPPEAVNPNGINRMKEELANEKEITSTTFFTPHEMATISLLADIIIPKDEVSGSAGDAKVPAFI